MLLEKNRYRQASICPNTLWFSASKLFLEKILALTYAWGHKFITTQAVHETSLDEESASAETVIDWYIMLGGLCRQKQHVRPVGIPGTTFKIDESKFGKKKYYKSRIFKGQCIRECKPYDNADLKLLRKKHSEFQSQNQPLLFL